MSFLNKLFGKKQDTTTNPSSTASPSSGGDISGHLSSAFGLTKDSSGRIQYKGLVAGKDNIPPPEVVKIVSGILERTPHRDFCIVPLDNQTLFVFIHQDNAPMAFQLLREMEVTEFGQVIEAVGGKHRYTMIEAGGVFYMKPKNT